MNETWQQELGWQRPAGRAWRDAHLVAALVLAAPVWVGLALWAGPWWRVPASAPAWISLVLVQTVLEELVFRGWMQGRWPSRWQPQAMRGWPVSGANLATTGVFVLAHLVHQPWAWALAVAVPSLVLGHLRERLHSVWPAMLVHMVYNLGLGMVALVITPSNAMHNTITAPEGQSIQVDTTSPRPQASVPMP